MQSGRKKYKNIVIVGGGPIGMYAALRGKKKKGLRNMTLVEKRPQLDTPRSQFTRPALLSLEVFKLVSKRLDTDISASDSQHIKDLERGLKPLIEQEHIPYITGSFVNIQPKHILVQLPSGEIARIPCDLLLDATGARRDAVVAVNRLRVEEKIVPAFIIDNVSDNPIPEHFYAYVGMNTKDAEELEHKSRQLNTVASLSEEEVTVQSKISAQQLIEIAELRRDFVWDYMTVPQCIVMQTSNKNKCSLYIELPKNLTSDQYEPWLKRVIRLIAGREITFFHLKVADQYKLHPKPRFNKVYVQPRVLKPFYFDDDVLPTVIPIGDALMEHDYRLGSGVGAGVTEVEILLSCMDIADDGVVINFDRYHRKIGALLDKCRTMLVALYAKRRVHLAFDWNVFIKQYIRQYIENQSSENRVAILEAVKSFLPSDKRPEFLYAFAWLLYKESTYEFKKSVLEETQRKIEILKRSYRLLSDAIKMMPDTKSAQNSMRTTLLPFLNEMTTKIKGLAAFHKEDKPFLARQYYLFALDLYQNQFPEQYQEILLLCFNIIMLSKKLKDSKTIIQYADIALQYIKRMHSMTREEQSVCVQIMHHKMVALLQHSQFISDLESLSKLQKTVHELLEELKLKKYQALAREMHLTPLTCAQQVQLQILMRKIETQQELSKQPQLVRSFTFSF